MDSDATLSANAPPPPEPVDPLTIQVDAQVVDLDGAPASRAATE